MKYILGIEYSEEENIFLETNNCAIISEIKMSKTDFTEREIPRRMIKYGGQYVAEIVDNETNEIVWAVLSKWKGVWLFSSYYDSLKNLIQGVWNL